MGSLIERQQAIPLLAPSMREIPITQNPAALHAIRQLIDGHFRHVILLTGVGTEALLELARTEALEQPLLQALRECTLIIRGPKPATVLSRLGLKYAVRAPEPNTWRELLQAIDNSGLSLAGQPVAVQEYGVPNHQLYAALAERQAIVCPVPVYRWALPENREPLIRALHKIAAGHVHAALFTSAGQVPNVLQVAKESGLEEAFRRAASSTLKIVSIGPACTETLKDEALPVRGEANPPKMGQLVRLAVELCTADPDFTVQVNGST
ncbi:MAG: uroporphyrinogen-III synthase [Planctomycetota bacterium]